MSRPSGIPLLGSPPPLHHGPSQSACRKCGREFRLLFNRQRKCMHCGYGYCSSCTDYQALLPRRNPSNGYDLAHVCAFCIDMLNITALGRTQLRSLPLAKLRRYISAYNIPVKNPVDKNDLVDAAVAARTTLGCLSPVDEDYYRKHSVPSFSAPGASNTSFVNGNSSSTRGTPNTNSSSSSRSNRPFPRPDIDPNRRGPPQEPAQATHTPRSTPNSQRSRTTSAPMNSRTARTADGQRNIPRPTSSNGRQSSPPTASRAHASSHSQHIHLPPPPMSTLVTLPRSSLSALSVGALKQIIWEARVRVPPGVVEKEELVERAWAIVEEERRKDNEGIDDDDDDGYEIDGDGVDELDREEEAVVETVDPEPELTHQHEPRSEHHHATTDRVDHGDNEGDSETTYGGHHSVSATDTVRPRSNTPPSSPRPSTSPSRSASRSKPRSHPNPTSTDRAGLCVICQDEEACIAIVDCGHLAMCRECSDLVLASSKECPLCRTRIVTEGRLLRIFKP